MYYDLKGGTNVNIVFDSKTGNVERFIAQLSDLHSIRITPNLIVTEPFMLVTYTTGFGNVPQTVKNFLHDNHQYLCGVSASGNKNWGDLFGQAADTISQAYMVPILSKFEMSGTSADVEYFKERVYQVGDKAYRTKQSSYSA